MLLSSSTLMAGLSYLWVNLPVKYFTWLPSSCCVFGSSCCSHFASISVLNALSRRNESTPLALSIALTTAASSKSRVGELDHFCFLRTISYSSYFRSVPNGLIKFLASSCRTCDYLPAVCISYFSS